MSDTAIRNEFSRIDRTFKDLEIRLRNEIEEKAAKAKFAAFEVIAARSIVLRAIIEELDEAQVERIKARAVALAGEKKIKKHVEEWFSPSKVDSSTD